MASTDFFDRQDQAGCETGWLVAYFVLAVVLIILDESLCGIHRDPRRVAKAPPAGRGDGDWVHCLIGLGRDRHGAGDPAGEPLQDHRPARRRGGRGAVARRKARRGERPRPGREAPLNVVEEMAPASGRRCRRSTSWMTSRGSTRLRRGPLAGHAVIGVMAGVWSMTSIATSSSVVARVEPHPQRGHAARPEAHGGPPAWNSSTTR